MSHVIDFLSNEVRMLEELNSTQHICKYRSVSHFVLENGRTWTPKPKPDDVEWMELKNCFGNCTVLSMSDPSKYIYCEGYAVSEFFPMLHAWCVTTEGEVIDPTWRDRGVEYYGIAIKADYLDSAMKLQNTYGLVDCWTRRWPLLHAEPKLWRHQINDLERMC